MSVKSRVLCSCIALGVAALFLLHLKSASVPESPRGPVVLTVMGKVADSEEVAEQKAFRDFSSRTGVQIRFEPSLQSVNERVDVFLSLLRSHSPEPDLIDMDVIWPATLGEHLVDLKPFFKDEIQDFAPELLRTFTVNGRLVALPTFINAGVLYYRPDLLRKYGFPGPPKTWEELDTMATRIQAGERRSGKLDFWGYVWQGGAFESLTCNALEWQSSSGGGEILGADRTVRVRNPRFLRALQRAVSWIGRISPPGQSAFGEEDALNFWLNGRAAFMRNWTGEYGGVIHSASAVRDLTRVAALPGGDGGRRGTLGGSGTGISKYSAHPEQALQALRAAVSEATQRDRAAMGGFIPTRIALRGRPEIMEMTPLHGHVADDVVENVVARPALQAGRSYNLVSRAYYTAVHSILTRRVSPEEGIARLETELVRITGFRAVR